jgi:excisionase family DNA binding protein
MEAATTTAVIDRIAPSGLMKPRQAADYLQITENTLQAWRSTNRKKLPYVKVGGQVRYRREDLDQFIAINVCNPVVRDAAGELP